MNEDFFSKIKNSNQIETGFNFSILPVDIVDTFKITALEIGIKRIALVGGVVRDQLLINHFQEPIYSVKDIDLIIEGSVYRLAKAIQSKLGAKRVSILRENKSYSTIEMQIDDISIDIATTRKESYPILAENPKIFNASIEEDLERRDFTINAIAFDLTNNKFIDLHKGSHGIKERQLKLIHSKSIAEDPTRIIRGARYAARLNFQLAPNSLKQIKSTLELWPWTWCNGENPIETPSALGVRLRMELELLLKEETWEQALQYLQDWGALSILSKELQDDRTSIRRVRWAIKLGISPLTALITGISNSSEISARLQFPKQQQKLLAETLILQRLLSEIHLTSDHLKWSPSNWCKVIEDANSHPDAIALLICLKIPLWKPLLKWLKRWQGIKSPVSPTELINKGWTPGPSLRNELKRLRYKRLDHFH